MIIFPLYNISVMNMNENALTIKKNSPKGEDGYKVFSIRIKDETIKELEEIANATGRSRNEIINLFLEFGLAHYEIEN